MYGPNRDEANAKLTTLHNEELRDVYSSPSAVNYKRLDMYVGLWKKMYIEFCGTYHLRARDGYRRTVLKQILGKQR
jgi:hypothetical protein